MTHQQQAHPLPHSPRHIFTIKLTATRRGARLARRLAVQQFTEWTGLDPRSDTAHAVALVTAELAANAVAHGTVPGRDFRLTLLLQPDAFRIEVTDTRPERVPEPVGTVPEACSGRGLALVLAYSKRWGCELRSPLTKVVWAEVGRLAAE
ncbi:MAG: ATP-binding protein [Streptomyces sp.]|nr:ATP-binding protein [Streptomyces sp.]